MNLTLTIIWLFVLGSIFWSLGSVLITRLWEGVNKEILSGIFFWFSRCPKCKKQLKPRNLIPIVSFFLQRGKCENCHQSISKFYPMIEIASWITFVLTYIGLVESGLGIIIFLLAINRLFLLLIIYDFQKLELHVPLRVLTLTVSLLGQFIFPIGNYGQAFYLSLLLGWICLWLSYGAAWYVKTKYKKKSEWFGQGDVMLGFLIGTLMPFIFSFGHISFSWERIAELLIVFFVLSSLLGILRYGILYLLNKATEGKTELKFFHYTLPMIDHTLKVIPFIPFMIFSFWILLFAGESFINLLFPRW